MTNIERARFTLEIVLRDHQGFERPISMAIGLDQELRISSRAVSELKSGFGLYSMDDAVTLMHTREMRKDLFIQTAERLGTLLAERMEDAEGWHDASRIDPARKQLGGEWS